MTLTFKHGNNWRDCEACLMGSHSVGSKTLGKYFLQAKEIYVIRLVIHLWKP